MTDIEKLEQILSINNIDPYQYNSNTQYVLLGTTLTDIYVLSNKLFNRNQGVSTCAPCLQNIMNDLIDWYKTNKEQPLLVGEVVEQKKKKSCCN